MKKPLAYEAVRAETGIYQAPALERVTPFSLGFTNVALDWGDIRCVQRTSWANVSALGATIPSMNALRNEGEATGLEVVLPVYLLGHPLHLA
ncbi:MAG: hypothetical protein M3317_01390 [Actinomycetota bacterium]|nr:hypothetical protein [Actinomycetota bacterium]